MTLLDRTGRRDLPLARLLLMEDANYPWVILVPRRPGVVELIDLAAADQVQLVALEALPRATAVPQAPPGELLQGLRRADRHDGPGERVAPVGERHEGSSWSRRVRSGSTTSAVAAGEAMVSNGATNRHCRLNWFIRGLEAYYRRHRKASTMRC